MIEHDSQVRNLVHQSNHGREHRRGLIRRVEPQAQIGKRLDVGDEIFLHHIRREVPSPQIAPANAAKDRVAMKTLKVLAEVGLAGLEISHLCDNQRFIRGDIEHPLIVLEPRTALHLNHAHDSQALGKLAIAVRQRGAVEDFVVLIVFLRPRNALRAGGVEEVDVRVDDGEWR